MNSKLIPPKTILRKIGWHTNKHWWSEQAKTIDGKNWPHAELRRQKRSEGRVCSTSNPTKYTESMLCWRYWNVPESYNKSVEVNSVICCRKTWETKAPQGSCYKLHKGVVTASTRELRSEWLFTKTANLTMMANHDPSIQRTKFCREQIHNETDDLLPQTCYVKCCPGYEQQDSHSQDNLVQHLMANK